MFYVYELGVFLSMQLTGFVGQLHATALFSLRLHLRTLTYLVGSLFDQLRVVTQEDVQFERFRRDSVGVFELKSMIEANSNLIEEAIKGAEDSTDAMYVCLSCLPALVALPAHPCALAGYNPTLAGWHI